MSQKPNSEKKIWNIISIILVAILVVIAVLLMGARIIGLNTYTIISGSMEPTYSVGDLIYVKTVSIDDVEVGDVISFVMNEQLTVATHRVVSIDEEHSCFYTKGDNNDTPDAEPVHFKNLIGKTVFAIPILGYVANYIQNPPGTYVAIGIGIVLLVLIFLPEKKKNKTKISEIENKSANENE